MSKHYFKRIFESIIARRKDSILIFSIIFILSFFIIVATCISRLGTNISNSVKDNIEIVFIQMMLSLKIMKIV